MCEEHIRQRLLTAAQEAGGTALLSRGGMVYAGPDLPTALAAAQAREGAAQVVFLVTDGVVPEELRAALV